MSASATPATVSVSASRQAIEHCLALLESHTGAEHTGVIQNARSGVLVLAWLERREELVRAIHDLDIRCPHLAELLFEFPGAKIVGVR